MTSYADTILSAVQDGHDLVAWAEPNTAVVADERTEAVLLTALGQPVAAEIAMGVPLLLFANTDIEAVPLVYGLVSNFAGSRRQQCCDRCRGRQNLDMPQLLVPMEGSAVVLNLCVHCRHTLDSSFPGLVWNA
jgi:hypothetical protein